MDHRKKSSAVFVFMISQNHASTKLENILPSTLLHSRFGWVGLAAVLPRGSSVGAHFKHETRTKNQLYLRHFTKASSRLLQRKKNVSSKRMPQVKTESWTHNGPEQNVRTSLYFCPLIHIPSNMEILHK